MAQSVGHRLDDKAPVATFTDHRPPCPQCHDCVNYPFFSPPHPHTPIHFLWSSHPTQTIVGAVKDDDDDDDNDTNDNINKNDNNKGISSDKTTR